MSGAREPRHDMTINSKPLGHFRRPADVVAQVEWEKGAMKMKVAPWELGGHSEMWDMSWFEGAVVSNHKHADAYESFLVTRGSIAFTVEGERILMRPGDMVHIPPHVAHKSEYLEEGTSFLSFFHNVNYFGLQADENTYRKYAPELLKDDAFVSEFWTKHNFIDVNAPPDTESEDGKPYLRRQGESLYTSIDEVGIARMKVAPWESDNVYQVWELVMNTGPLISGHLHRYGWEVFVMIQGAVEFTVGETMQLAKPGDVVLVPPFTPHAMNMLEQDTTCMIYMQNYQFYRAKCEKAILRANEPEKYADPDFMRSLNEQYDSFEYEY